MRQPTLKAYVDAHHGEKFLVCGMGTSIDQFPVEFFENWDGVTIGVNEITDLFTPDYHFPNYAVYPSMENSIVARGVDRPISFEYTSPSAHIDIHKTGKLSKRGTVAMPAFTTAYQMGASEIYIIGVDFMSSENGEIYFKECSKKAPERYQLADRQDPELQATIRCFQDGITQYKTQGVKTISLSKHSILNELRDIERA